LVLDNRDQSRNNSVLNTRKEEKMDRLSFKKSDLTNEFFDKVVYVIQDFSSGMGGPGNIIMFTSNGDEYYLGIEGYDESHPENVVPILECYYDSSQNSYTFSAESNGWIAIRNDAMSRASLIRRDFMDKIKDVYEEKSKNEKRVYTISIVRDYFKTKENRMIFVLMETLAKIHEFEKWEMEQDAKQRAIRLTEEDITWRPIYVNNICENSVMGEYLLLFKQDENGVKQGVKWTIEYQKKELDHMHIDPSITERYNLFYKDFGTVYGVLGYKEPNSRGESYYRESSIHDEIQSPGRFVRSYDSLERAKEAAIYRNEHSWGGINKENIVRVSLDETSIQAMKREYENKNGYKY
jgi:curved DNA-binding protein CbpA